MWDPYFKYVGIAPLFSMVEFFRFSLQPCLSDTNQAQLLAPRVKRILLSPFLHTWGLSVAAGRKMTLDPVRIPRI